jgi:fructosamine-3-kinase
MLCKSSLLEAIHNAMSDTLGKIAAPQWLQDLSGGDINRAALIGSSNRKWFLKYNQAAPDGMFAAEALALDEIGQQNCIKVPAPVVFGSDGDTAWLVLEYLELSAHGAAALLGEQLAALHSVKFQHFGWKRDNFIGSTAQINKHSNDWGEFWRDARLKPQLVMAEAAGFGAQLADKGHRLLENMSHFMENHRPAASLLHGDLWSGNKAFTLDGQPVVFDPASYYGDRETDIAMTELFGGFGADFYSAYNAISPLPDGYQLRRDLYNLYHMLNHLNLFGAGYLSRCERIIDHLLMQVR